VWHGEYRDTRLVEVYDAVCTWSRDDEYFCRLVDEVAATRILDLGCGTGRLTLALAAEPGREVVGVDPAPASLAAARRKPGAARVRWIEGTSAVLHDADVAPVDAAVMTAHVVQLLVDDDVLHRTLADVASVLAPGGVLAFDSRDPSARGWERWNRRDSSRRVALAGGREVLTWVDVDRVHGSITTGPTVDFTHHYVFDGGDLAQSRASLRFRTEDQLRAALTATGYTVDAVHGGWDRDPVGAPDGELLFVARRDDRGV
jgi:SAM-dependent methyltransferase